MDRANAARIQEWDARPVSGGYRGLEELADGGFSGAVTTGTAWLFLLNGRVVGVADGTLSSFESGDLTAREAPDPTLPLLFAMQERGGEVQAKYYTDDNPLPEVHETLSEAGFTGYIELSENVLSGDYYVVYYGGRSMSAAFVGNAQRLVTGDDAFRQAAEEVGIYQVMDVELDVRDVPEPAADQTAGGAAVPADEPDESPEPAVEPEPDDPPAAEPEPEPAPDPEPEPEPTADPDPEPAERDSAPTADSPEPTDSATSPAEDRQPENDDPFTQEAAWREARTIPALDPEETDPPTAAEDGGQQPAQPEPEPEPAPEPTPEPAVDDDRIARLEAAIEEQNETIASLESRLESSSAEAETLREERAELRRELEAARAAEGATSAPAGGTPTIDSLDAETALDQTDLFVRYGSKAGGTLEKAHDGVLDREEVISNLRIDHHTRFEEDAATVEGRDFHAFLEDSLEYRFVYWLITALLFEIQDTGSQRGLRDLFDALPLVDRAEFYGEVTWRDPDEGETHTREFDVVCRDRMGQPLVVANLNDVRDPATGEMMDALVDGASEIAEGVESLGCAFLVTSSFFQPDALERASEATGGGILSRDKRWSYVKLGRRHGYHLCLVEARGDDFHVAVPEL